MRISDWSSDVCSSDLLAAAAGAPAAPEDGATAACVTGRVTALEASVVPVADAGAAALAVAPTGGIDRKSVEEGQSVSLRVDLGGRSLIKKNTANNKSTSIHPTTIHKTHDLYKK